MMVDVISKGRSFQLLAVVLTALAVVSMDCRLQAAELALCDLDSLVYQSDEIVEGFVVDGWDDAVELRIARVHAGAEAPNTTIRVYLREYAKGSSTTSLTHFSAGDQLLLFLSKGKLVPCGLALIVRGRCYPAYQWSSRGGYIAEPIDGPNAQFGTLTQFRTAIQISVRKVAVWRSRFSRPVSRNDIPWLLATIAERRKSAESFAGDAVLWNADQRLLTIGDFPALEAALAMGAGDPRGFDSPSGREYLLRRIGDPEVPIQTRLKLADILQWAGGNSSTDNAGAPAPALSHPTNDMGTGGGWLTRVARLISALPQKDGELKTRLAEQLCSKIDLALRDSHSTIPPDAQAAAEVLAATYATETSDAVRCQIEMILLKVGIAGYERLHSPSVPIISWTEPQIQDSPIEGGRLLVTVRALTSGTSKVTSARLVLKSVDRGGKSYLLPSGIVGQNMSTSPGYSWAENDSLTLPIGFCPGRYHLFFEFLNGSQVVSVGHGSEANLSIPLAPPGPSISSRLSRTLSNWDERRTIWLIVALSSAAALALLRRAVWSRRQVARFRAGLCTRCAYDLRASPNRCPECGTSNPTQYRTGGTRRSILKMARAALLVALLGMLFVWARSYRIGECLTRTSAYRADSLYSTSGRIEIVMDTDPAARTWSYDRVAPADLPRNASEFAAFATWRAIGVEHVPALGWTFISDWLIATVLGFAALVLQWIARFPGRTIFSPVHRPTA